MTATDPHAAAAVEQIRRLRTRHGHTLEDVAAAIGTTFRAVSDFEHNDGSRKLGTIQAHAYGIGHRTVFDLHGLPDIDAPDAAQMAAVACGTVDWHRRHAFERAALGALLRAHREHQGLRQADLAARLGNTKSTVGYVETMDQDPLIRTVAAHVTGLGGQLEVRFVLADDEAVAARIGELVAELAEYAVTAPRWKVTTTAGAMKGIPGPDAWRIAEQHAGTVHRSRIHVLPTGHEVLDPWLEVPPLESN